MPNAPTPAAMRNRVAFWKDLRPSRRAFVDSVLAAARARGVALDADGNVIDAPA